jgi:hypothetical protein
MPTSRDNDAETFKDWQTDPTTSRVLHKFPLRDGKTTDARSTRVVAMRKGKGRAFSEQRLARARDSVHFHQK